MIERKKRVKNLKNVRVICELPGNKKLIYYTGKFDDFCIAVVYPSGMYDTPLDSEYFTSLRDFGKVFGNERTNRLFLRVYSLVEKRMPAPLEKDFMLIRKCVESYIGEKTEYFNEVYEIMCILYAAMISEENHLYNGKVYVGKDVKKTGVHLLLIDGYSPYDAANLLRDMRWREINKLSIKHNLAINLPAKFWRVNGYQFK